MADTPLIPREILFGNPEKASPQISPDGKKIAYLAPLNGVLNIWLSPEDGSPAYPVTRDSDRGVRIYFWGQNSRQLFFLQDSGGNENWRLYSIGINGEDQKDLTPFDDVQVRLIDSDKHFPDELILAINKDNPALHDAYRLDLKTGQLTLLEKNPGNISSWIADPRLKIRAAVTTRPDGGQDLLFKEEGETAWKVLVSWSREDSMTSAPLGWTLDGKKMYLRDCRGRDTAQLVLISLSGGAPETLSQDSSYDVENIMLQPDSYALQLASYQKDRVEYHFFDKTIEADFTYLKKLSDGDLFIQSRDNSDKNWIVGFQKDDGPAVFYKYDRTLKKEAFLFENRPALTRYSLAPMEPVSFVSRDGLTIHGYLTFPPNASAKKNLPMVLNVHGGPWARDSWGYDSEAQWLANRGYLCFQVNFRGSTGYGKKFVNAGNKEWGGKMQDDLTDSVEWAVKQGYADPKKVVIYGGSYGGYAALAGATFTPDLYCAIVAIVGPSNLLTFIKTIPPYWGIYLTEFHQRVGNPDTEEAFLKSRSPLFNIHRIKSPLLIAQGANDPRVKQAESEQIVAALQEKGLEYEYLLFPDEGHGFAKPANRLKFYASCESFLSKHLGGRAEK